MAEKPDNVGGVEITEAEAGPGHNQPKEVVWERWQKKRTFVRALEGTYGELQQGLMDQPRIYKSKDWAWKGGPQFFDKPIINPQRTDIAQSIETHISVIAPGGTAVINVDDCYAGQVIAAAEKRGLKVMTVREAAAEVQ